MSKTAKHSLQGVHNFIYDMQAKCVVFFFKKKTSQHKKKQVAPPV